ncbi:MAG: geranylgeranylglycerol-phosphate geranylgeranyltransferase [Flavobacteriales bacterium]|nr:geranylgeranylglycerol-phosphate geranylgeranyltransferase [Flavobacteriales bacterium]
MNPISAFFKAIRIQNLVIGVFTMYGIRYAVLIPLLEKVPYRFQQVLNINGQQVAQNHEKLFELQLTHLDFSLLVLSFLLLAAAGNIINDYFDLKIDRINKPDKMVIGRYIKRRVAMASHVIMNGFSVLLAGYVAWRAGSIEFALIQVICIIILWFYSTDLKRRFVWGNVSIAFVTALIPLSIAIYEIPPLVETSRGFLENNPQAYEQFQGLIYSILFWCMGFAGFAFLLTLAREITKDIVDQKGDMAYKCQTVPIVMGNKFSVRLVNSLYIITILGALAIQHYLLPDRLTLMYILFLLGPVLLLTFYLTARARTDAQFYFPAQMNKLATLVGIGYTLIVYYILTYQM